MIDPVKTDQATAPKIKIRIIMYTISIIKKKNKNKKKRVAILSDHYSRLKYK